MRRDSARTNLLPKIGLPLVAAVFALGLAEIGMRLADKDLNRQPHLRYSRRYGWLLDPEFTEIDRFNQYGFRGPAPSGAKAERTKRLLVIGDSFTFAGAQPYALTYSALLEEWLGRDEANRWEVANLSVPDWGTAQELLALEHVGIAWDPDVVILQLFPYNDLCNNTLEMANTCGAFQDHHRPYFELDEAGELRRRFSSPWASRLRAVSRLFGLVEEAWIAFARRNLSKGSVARENLRAVGLPDHWGSTFAMIPGGEQPEVIRRGWEVTGELLAEIHRLTSRQGAQLVAVTIPYHSSFDPSWVARQEVAGIPLDPSHDTRAAATMLADNGIPHLSMREQIEASGLPSSSFFISHENGHLSDLGHAHLAQWILEELGRRGATLVSAPKLDYRVAADLIATDQPAGFTLTGLTPTREIEGNVWRFGLGPSTTIEFGDTLARTMALSFSAVGLFPGQEFGIEINGSPVHHVADLPVQRSAVRDSVTFQTAAGRNTVTFRYKDWNRRSEAYLPKEARFLAVKFIGLALQETGPARSQEARSQAANAQEADAPQD
jgi:hypothetical protein